MVENSRTHLVTNALWSDSYVKYVKIRHTSKGFVITCISIVAIIYDTARCNIYNCN